MSILTIPQHITHSTLFRNWLEAINGIIDEEIEIYEVLETKAPKNHATQSQAFGLGNSEVYGHLKLTDELSLELDQSQGYAATPKAVQQFYDEFSLRLDRIEEEFYASLQELRTDLQEQIDELSESVAGKAPIYHASSETTYGKGNAILYGHLRLNSSRSALYGTDEGYAATPSAVQNAYDDAVAYVDSFDIDSRIEALGRRIDQTDQNVDELEDRVEANEDAIEEIQSKLIGLEVYFFEEDLAVDAAKKQYGAYVFRNASAEAALTLGLCCDNIKITVSNESAYPLTIQPKLGCTINGQTHPLVLGINDSASFIQNPASSIGTANWSLTGQETTMHSALEVPARASVVIEMSSEKSQIVEVDGTCSVQFVPGTASSSGRAEYAEKTVLFYAATAGSHITWPEDIVWMDMYEEPEWGIDAGDTLIVKAYQIGRAVFLEQKHNSHIVPGLDPRLVRIGSHEAPPAPSMSVQCAPVSQPVNGTGYDLGESVQLEITVVNTGNVPLRDISVDSGRLQGSWTIEFLDVGASAVLPASYDDVSETDILEGEIAIDIAAVASSEEGTEDVEAATESILPTAAPDGRLSSSVQEANPAPQGGHPLGSQISYEITVANSGNITVSNIETGGDRLGDIWNKDYLYPGQTQTYTAHCVVTEADIISGSIGISIYSSGTGADDASVYVSSETVSVPESKNSELTVQCIETSSPADSAGYAADELILYKIVLTNTGNLTITDIHLTDENTGEMWNIDSLAPGAAEQKTTQHLVDEDELPQGSYVNYAAASGTSPDPDSRECSAVSANCTSALKAS